MKSYAETFKPQCTSQFLTIPEHLSSIIALSTKKECSLRDDLFYLKRLIISIIFPVAGLLGQAGSPPVPPPPPPATASPLPVDVLYRAFFRHVSALDQAAAAIEIKQGKSGADIRNYYQKTLGLTDHQAALLKQTALACNQAVEQQNQRAQSVIGSARSKAPRVLISAATAPPVPVELAELEHGRTEITSLHIRSLQSSLGADTAARLDQYVKTKFAPNVSAVPVVKHTPKDKVSLPPFAAVGATN